MLNNAFDSCPILKYRQNRNQKRKIETHDTFLRGQIGSFEFFCLLQLKLSHTVAGFTDICPKIKIMSQVRIELTTPREHTEKAKC